MRTPKSLRRRGAGRAVPVLELIAERRIAGYAPREVEEAGKGGRRLSLLNARIEARYFRKVVRKLGR